MNSLFSAAQACIAAADPRRKVELTEHCSAAWAAGELILEDRSAPAPIADPGRPARPELVAAQQLHPRSPHTIQGRAALIHAIAHIEFNAINLAWDAVCRFAGMPAEFYRDWASVADEEAYHFRLLRERLGSLGHEYGDLPAHNGLWAMALQTRDDALIRMALVPRVLEARGLDVTPGLIQRLEEVGDAESVAVLQIILRDEIGHVAIGSRWFEYLCRQRGLEPRATFRKLLNEYMRGQIKGPFHRAAREQAGFSAAELDDLEAL